MESDDTLFAVFPENVPDIFIDAVMDSCPPVKFRFVSPTSPVEVPSDVMTLLSA
jgi:hypothetical protein